LDSFSLVRIRVELSGFPKFLNSPVARANVTRFAPLHHGTFGPVRQDDHVPKAGQRTIVDPLARFFLSTPKHFTVEIGPGKLDVEFQFERRIPMPAHRRWFDRKFELGLPPEAIPEIIERLRGTPARLEERFRRPAS
jgi:hypothetical protein